MTFLTAYFRWTISGKKQQAGKFLKVLLNIPGCMNPLFSGKKKLQKWYLAPIFTTIN